MCGASRLERVMAREALIKVNRENFATLKPLKYRKYLVFFDFCVFFIGFLRTKRDMLRIAKRRMAI